MASSRIFACRWDWCRSSFPTLDALQTHVKHEHIWPMNPMRKTEIALMRRADLDDLHSSQNTDSSIISRGLLNQLNTPLPVLPLERTTNANPHPEESFDGSTQLSSLPQTHSSQPVPAFGDLVRQDGPSGSSAALEIFERNHGHKADQHVYSLSTHSSSPPSRRSRSSQEMVEQELTQEDDILSQPLPSNLQADHEFDGVELVWPPEGEHPTAEIPDIQQPTLDHDYHMGSSPDPTRGKAFRSGSLNVPLVAPSNSQSPCTDSQESNASSQPFVLQTQAPYSSQPVVWSQSE